MPSLLGMRGIEAAADGRAHFVAGRVRKNEIAPAGAIALACGDQGGDHHRRYVPAEILGGVVEIERVGRNAVHERGIERAGAPVRSENQGRAVAGRKLERFHDELRGVFGDAGEGDAHRVEHGDLAPPDGFRRKIFISHRMDAFSELARQSHTIRPLFLQSIMPASPPRPLTP